MTNPIQPDLGAGLPLKEPKLYDVLQAFKANLLVNLHCAKIGKILTFDPTTFSASVQVLFQRVMNDGQIATYPLLANVPVVTLQGGGASVQLPITPGDQCLLIFADRNIDAWFQNGGNQPPPDGRLHDISDGFALVGINFSGAVNIPDISPTEARMILSDGTTKVGLQTGKVTVANAATTLLVLLDGLIDVIKALTVQDDEGGNILPLTAASIAALEAYKVQLATLLY